MYSNADNQPPEMAKERGGMELDEEAKILYLHHINNSTESESMERLENRTGERDNINIKYKPERQMILTALVDSTVKEQTEIGWNLFSGERLSKKWQKSLELHHGDRLKLDPKVKLTPCLSLIAKLWEMRLQLWGNRNDMKHGKTPEEQ